MLFVACCIALLLCLTGAQEAYQSPASHPHTYSFPLELLGHWSGSCVTMGYNPGPDTGKCTPNQEVVTYTYQPHFWVDTGANKHQLRGAYVEGTTTSTVNGKNYTIFGYMQPGTALTVVPPSQASPYSAVSTSSTGYCAVVGVTGSPTFLFTVTTTASGQWMYTEEGYLNATTGNLNSVACTKTGPLVCNSQMVNYVCTAYKL